MKKKGKHNSDEEFPVLGGLGLYAGSIIGDGNCLFRALSDQLYGDQERYASVRAEVLSYILNARDRFEPFTGIYDESFETYTRRMAQDSTYGGHLEIVAFSEVHRAQVIIYQGEIQYAVNPQDSEPVIKVHIAYHIWEHYSSVRNKSGPHTGLPAVDPTPCEVEARVFEGDVPQWQVDLILQSCPECSEEKARILLGKKDYNAVIEDLLTGQEEPENAPEAPMAPMAPEVPVAPKDQKQERKDRRAEKRRERQSAKRDKVEDAVPEPTPALSTKAQRSTRKAAKKTKDFERKWAKKKEKSSVEPAKPAAKTEGPIFI